ncbi:MFS transporter [soil metagenome]
MHVQLTTSQPTSNFIKFWIGQSISLFGSGVAFPTLQLTAAVFLGASPAQIGLLVAMGSLPSLLLGLFAGVWVDRQKRRPLLIMADLGRSFFLLLIVLSAFMGTLQIVQLYITAFIAGLFTLISDVAYRAYLPSVVHRQQLLQANSRFEASQSAAETVGPGIAGALVQLITAPFALLVNGGSFLVSALIVTTLPDVEAAPHSPIARQSILKEIREGLHLVATNRYLRAIAGNISTVGLFYSMLETVFLVHMTRDLKLEPGWIGFVFVGGALGFILAAWLTQATARRFGLGPTLMTALLVLGLGNLVLALAVGAKISVILILMLGYTLFGLGHTAYNITQISLRQAITPNHLQGRMNATMEFALWGIAPVGALLGGLLGEYFGLRPVILVTALGELLGVLWLYYSPVRTLFAHPQPLEIKRENVHID